MMLIKRLENTVIPRLPGGDFWKLYVATKKLTGTKYASFAPYYKHLFWHGSEGLDFQPVVQGLSEAFSNEEAYDFEIIKLIKEPEYAAPFFAGINELILPYLLNIQADFGEGTYETDDIKVEKGDIVIDAGAHHGLFTVFAAKYREAFVHAFEPVASIGEILQRNVKLNEVEDKTTIVRSALSDTIGEGEIYVNGGASTLMPEGMAGYTYDRTEIISLTTVDRYVEEQQLPRVDFIKADIEGSERDMLRGASVTLRRFKPKLAICTYHLPNDREVLTQIIKEANPEYKFFYKKEKLIAW